MMYTIQSVYETYRRVQGRLLGRPYRLPKDFSAWFVNANKPTQENLEKLTLYMNTKWQNIDLEMYFEMGFSLWKAFSYHQFLNPKVLNLYIDKDKLKKRSLVGCKADLIKSFKHIKTAYNGYTFDDYCSLREGNISQPVSDFLSNKIGKYGLTYLIHQQYLTLSDYERSLVSVVVLNYRDIVEELRSLGDDYRK